LNAEERRKQRNGYRDRHPNPGAVSADESGMDQFIVEARRASDAISATLFPLLTPSFRLSKVLGVLIPSYSSAYDELHETKIR
jgi:hypothetical protein